MSSASQVYPTNQAWTPKELMPELRALLSENREFGQPSAEEAAMRLQASLWSVEAALEALTVEGGVLS